MAEAVEEQVEDQVLRGHPFARVILDRVVEAVEAVEAVEERVLEEPVVVLLMPCSCIIIQLLEILLDANLLQEQAV